MTKEEKIKKMKEQKCRFHFERGFCIKGDRCEYSHKEVAPGIDSFVIVRGSKGLGERGGLRGSLRGYERGSLRGYARGTIWGYGRGGHSDRGSLEEESVLPSEPRVEWRHDETDSERGRVSYRGRGGLSSRGGRGGFRGGTHFERPFTAIKRKDSYDDDDEVDTTELSQQVQKINKDLIRIEPARKALCAAKSLDIMFIIDCTGSMCSWIEASKREIKSIIGCVRNQYFGIKIRVSIVAYRDHCDGELISEVFDFTTDIEKCHDFIGKLRATGGGDAPEDIAGGFENALKQEWQAKTKYAILIADAPCHGIQYHGSHGDDYPRGDPKGRLIEKQIEEFAEKKIHFNAIRIHPGTNQMFEILNKHYQEKMGQSIQFADLGSSTQNFNFFVTQSISQSITLSSGNSSSNGSLMNKLISLSSEGKFSIIDSVLNKVSASKKSVGSGETSSYEVISSSKVGGGSTT